MFNPSPASAPAQCFGSNFLPQAPGLCPWPGPERRASIAAAQGWLSAMLDEIDYGMFLLDARLKVHFANRAARAQLNTIHSLALDRDDLVVTLPDDRRALSAAIEAAVGQGLRRMVTIGSEAARIAVAVVPLSQVALPADTRVLMLLSRQQLCETLSAHGFARDHGLSGSESNVLRALCQGLQPSEIAAGHGVAISTVRTQIANIRLKTDVASIVELVQRLARLPPIRNALRHEARLGTIEAAV